MSEDDDKEIDEEYHDMFGLKEPWSTAVFVGIVVIASGIALYLILGG